MNVVSVMQADCRMNLLEIFLRWLMRKIFHVRLLPAVSTPPNCLNHKGFEPDVRILLTKYSNSNGSQSPWMEEQIRDAWGSMVLKNVVRETDEVGKGQIRMRTVFEQAIDQRSSTGAWRNALSIWEPVCNEIFDRLIKPRWEIR
jgi:hypothetical protein